MQRRPRFAKRSDRLAEAQLFDDAHHVLVRDIVQFVLVFLFKPLTEIFCGDESRLPGRKLAGAPPDRIGHRAGD